MPGRDDDEPLTLACDLTVFSADDRDAHGSALAAVRAATLERVDVADGYRFRLEAGPGVLAAVAAFIEHERLCCPFFTFTLEVEPPPGSTWLQLTGPDGAKEIIATVGETLDTRQPTS